VTTESVFRIQNFDSIGGLNGSLEDAEEEGEVKRGGDGPFVTKK